MPSHISVSFGTPVRKTMILKPNISNDRLTIENVQTLSDPLIENGFGHMYSGGFVRRKILYCAIFCRVEYTQGCDIQCKE